MAGDGLPVTPDAAQPMYGGGSCDAFILKITGFGAAPPAVKATGDLNGDGRVNIGDATLLLRITVGSRAATPEEQGVADLNGDGRLNIQDAILVLRKAVGLLGSGRQFCNHLGFTLSLGLIDPTQ